MMHSENIRLESGPYGSLLVWRPGNSNDLVQYQLHLLTRQRPGYLLPCFLSYRDSLPQLCLDVTGLVSIDQFGRGNDLNPQSGRALLLELLEVLIDAADRLLPVRQFSLHPSLIFRGTDQKIRLAFWPACPLSPNKTAEDEWGELQDLLHIIGQAYRLLPDQINRYLQVLQHGGMSLLYQQIVAESDVRQNSEGTSEDSSGKLASRKKYAAILRSGRIIGLSALHILGAGVVCCNNFIQTAWPSQIRFALLAYLVVLLILDLCCLMAKGRLSKLIIQGHSSVRQTASGLARWLQDQISGHKSGELVETDAQTVLLAANPAEFRMALLSEGLPGTAEENEGLRAYILVDEFVVGRDQKTSDLCLNDPGVGRQHARIIRRAGSFFICDLGSRNGTCLDGRKIMKNMENLLPDQCRISFASHSFYFQAD